MPAARTSAGSKRTGLVMSQGLTRRRLRRSGTVAIVCRSADPYGIACSLRDAGPWSCASSGDRIYASPNATTGSANAVATNLLRAPVA